MRRKGKTMSLITQIKIILVLGFFIVAPVMVAKTLETLAYPFASLIAVIAVLSLLWAFVKVYPTHRLIRSAEWELMELVHRVEVGADSRKGKAEEKISYFSRLAKETQEVYTGPAKAGGHRWVGDLPKAPFRNENLLLMNSQDNEMEKFSKRKVRVRLNAALLRELLYGTKWGWETRMRKLTAAEKANVMATIESLGKVDGTLIWFTSRLYGHPSKIIRWEPKKLQGKKALDYLSHV